MCSLYPTTAEALLSVTGVGAKKLERYGAPFLQAITDYLDGEE
jgi:ATP-dependent DNA helicase RecQ